MTTNGKTKNVVLWVVQGLLAVLFLVAGVSKFLLSPEMMKGPILLPIGFLRFIGVAEVLGAMGLILPGLLRIHQDLTPLAARGLATIMVGAIVVTVAGGTVAPALIPLAVGTLAVFVALGRRPTLEADTRELLAPFERVTGSGLKA